MDRLPLEVVHCILEYDGRIKYRNGKFMNQITQDDDRYKMLLKRAPKYFETQMLDDGNVIYKTRVELTKFTFMCIQNHPLWYCKTFLVCKCRNSGLYKKMYRIT